MYFGHYAVAIAAKAKQPDIPTAPLLVGTGLLDILNGIFIMGGIDKVTPNLEASPYLFFDLTFIDWDHSLFMATFWSLLFGAVCWLLYKKDKKIGIISALVAFLHFVSDIPMHNADLALYPYSNTKIGLGLWGSLGTWSWIIEVIFTILLLTYAWKKHKKRGENLWIQVAFIGLLCVQLSPRFSPMKKIATLSEPMASLLHGLAVFSGFVVPGLILMWMYRRSEQKVKL